MPKYKSSQEWFDQSSLLLEARPATTRITTHYAIVPPPPPRHPKEQASTTIGDAGAPGAPENNAVNAKRRAAVMSPRAHIELKTYDTASGTTLKYRTTKAAEVSRLILALGKLGRRMAALPEEHRAIDATADEDMPDAPPPARAAEAGSVTIEEAKGKVAASSSGGSGKKKRKKGKK